MVKSFDRWMKNVNNILHNKLGLFAEDLEDWGWRDSYEWGVPEDQAVYEFLQDIEIPEELIDEP